jgi:predicted nucleic acid-binding protein
VAAHSRRLRIAEPRGAYSTRPPLVADASVMAAALFGESGDIEAIALLHGRALHAPHLLDFEIASVGLKKLARDRVARDAVAAALRAYGQLAIERHSVNVESMLSVAERYRLTAYDAAYLCVAGSIGAPLATLDAKLADAARAHLAGAPQIYEPE